MNALLPPVVLSLVPALAAQTTLLVEDFQAGPIPPVGWQNLNLNGSSTTGWREPASIYPGTTRRAWHQDESASLGTADNVLVLPALDLSGLSQAYVHFRSEVYYAPWLAHYPQSAGDGVNTVEVSLDGGATWTVVWTDDTIQSGKEEWMNADLSVAAGNANVLVGFHYYGTYAHQWYVDDVVVDDQPFEPPTPIAANLPTTFRTAPFLEDFETPGAVLHTYMARTSVDRITGLPDSAILCNVGQEASMWYAPYSGSWALEMGRKVWSGATNDYRNMFVLGVDGQGATDVRLEAKVINHQDEIDNFDGIWISQDGAGWYEVMLDWSAYDDTGWQDLAPIELANRGVDVGGEFFLMFTQEDDLNFGYDDGIGLDDVRVGEPAAPNHAVHDLVVGASAGLVVTEAVPGSFVVFAYSLTGGAAIPTAWGTLGLAPPFFVLGVEAANALGNALHAPLVPNVAGQTVWSQCFANGALTNTVSVVVQ